MAFFLLDFVTNGKRRISYASSFAQAKLEEKFRKDMADSLRGFFSIAVRESNGVKIVKKLIGKDVPITLDPTLLLRKDDYGPLIKQKFTAYSKSLICWFIFCNMHMTLIRMLQNLFVKYISKQDCMWYVWTSRQNNILE